ncbi:MAG TPA: GGIII-like transmembrane region-containing protein [Candidatus Bathyarchaeia archaeon]|nr:GGIII-like transmembrane region-containing protein [Candidatus Bathyarchaeia archaeon]
MNFRKTKIMLTIFVILLFPLSSVLTISVKASIQNDDQLLLNGTGSYSEDFTTITYKGTGTTGYGWGTGVVTKNRDYTWEMLDFYPTEYPAYGLDIEGRKAYITAYNKTTPSYSLQAFDLSNSRDIHRTSYRNSLNAMYEVKIDGDVLYAGTTDSLLQPRVATYNVSNPFSLSAFGVFRSSYLTNSSVTDLDVEGYLVYYTTYNALDGFSLRILNAEDIDYVFSVTCPWASNKALGLEVDGQLAYVAASNEGFYILNVSQRNIVTYELGYLDTPGNASDVIIDGARAYLADGEAGIHIIDVQNPNNPVLLGSYDTPGFARRLVLQGKTLYVADGDGGVQILDVADPTHPALVLEIDSLPHVNNIDLYGGIIVVTTDEGIHTIRCSPDMGLADFSTSFYANTFDMYNCYDVKVKGNVAYVAAGRDGFYTLDVSDPVNPILLDWVNITNVWEDYRKLDVYGQYAYVVDSGGVYVYDISDPTNIQQINFLIGNILQDIFIQGDIAYITWGLGGLAIVNISSPSTFTWSDELSEPHFGSNTTSIWVQGPHVYVTNFDSGVSSDTLVIIDTTPAITAPHIDDIDVRTSYGLDVCVDGDIAYVSDQNWLVIFNVSDPFSINFLSDVLIGDYIDSFGVCSFGPYLMNAGGAEGVSLINATRLGPSQQTKTTYANATAALQITYHGDYTYVANKTNLIILRHFKSPGDIYVSGNSEVISTDIDGADIKITKATLTFDGFIPDGSSINFYMMVDELHWEPIIPGTEHVFTYEGSILQWRAVLTSTTDRSVHLYNVNVNYSTPFLSGNMLWIIIGAGGGLLLILIIIIIAASVSKKKKKIPTR